MSSVDLVPLVDEGLGNTSYLLDLGDGRALAVDVSRDLRRLRGLSEERGLRIAFAAETHLHADFLSGACQLAARGQVRVDRRGSADRVPPSSLGPAGRPMRLDATEPPPGSGGTRGREVKPWRVSPGQGPRALQE